MECDTNNWGWPDTVALIGSVGLIMLAIFGLVYLYVRYFNKG